MTTTSVGAVVRQQGWFRALVDVNGLEPFSPERATLLPLQPTGAFRATVRIGRGPVVHDLTADFVLWFDHGELPYPVFECPSIGPSGAGLHGAAKPRQVTAGADEALCVIDVSLIQPVAPPFQEEYERDPQADTPGGPAVTVRSWLAEAGAWLEHAVGIYALYQYPIVWEPLALHPVVGFVDLEAKTFKLGTPTQPDNFIPFRLNVAAKMKDGQLDDGALSGMSALADKSLHFPLVLLQRALWQKNVQLRFLETFLLLDYLTGQFSGKDEERPRREALFKAIEECIQREHPEHYSRIQSLKHVVLQAPLRDRIGQYLRHLQIEQDEPGLRRMLRVRNDLAHARSVDARELAEVELGVRCLVREVLRRELVLRGVTFELPPSSPTPAEGAA